MVTLVFVRLNKCSYFKYHVINYNPLFLPILLLICRILLLLLLFFLLLFFVGPRAQIKAH